MRVKIDHIIKRIQVVHLTKKLLLLLYRDLEYQENKRSWADKLSKFEIANGNTKEETIYQ